MTLCASSALQHPRALAYPALFRLWRESQGFPGISGELRNKRHKSAIRKLAYACQSLLYAFHGNHPHSGNFLLWRIGTGHQGKAESQFG